MLAFALSTLLYIAPFLFVLMLVVMIHELGHFGMARAFGVAVDRFSIGFGRPLMHWTDRSGVQWRIGWLPLGGYVRFAGDAEASSTLPDADDLTEMRRDVILREGVGADRKYYHFKPVWQRALIAAAGPCANFLFALVVLTGLLSIFGQSVYAPRVDSLVRGGAAERAGFRLGDLITAIDGRPVDDFRQLEVYVTIRPGQAMRFDLKRGSQRLQIVAAPELKDKANELTGAVKKAGVLGIGNGGPGERPTRRLYNPIQAVGVAAGQCVDMIGTTVTYLARVVTGRVPANQLGGFIGIAAATHGAAKLGAAGATTPWMMLAGSLVTLLSLAAQISVGIGFLNLLPVPVLDGGHLVFYAYEAVARRPLAARVQAVGYRVGLALLLGLMLFAAWNDLSQLSVFKHIGGLFS